MPTVFHGSAIVARASLAVAGAEDSAIAGCVSVMRARLDPEPEIELITAGALAVDACSATTRADEPERWSVGNGSVGITRLLDSVSRLRRRNSERMSEAC
jgi:hypothetical protein